MMMVTLSTRPSRLEADLLLEHMRDGAQSAQHSALPTAIIGPLAGRLAPTTSRPPTGSNRDRIEIASMAA